jgi:hypothetical protein
MPRYLVERSFPEGLAIPVDDQGAKACQPPVDRITEVRVLDPYFYR